jgi:nickel-dependent lactate racemase
MKIEIPFEGGPIEAELPDGAEILRMAETAPLAEPGEAVRRALREPIGCRSLEAVARSRRAGRAGARACVVVSDKTRPVPYRGPEGLLAPILDTLIAAGFAPGDVTILVATGMHSEMGRAELEKMLGPEPFARGFPVACHDCRDLASLANAGTTARGTEALVDRRYVEADLKILTGLVESHFMAGASGGRKSVCPGLLGEAGTKVFHGPALMSHPNTRDLLLEGNPVHEESLAVARLAGADFIANVTVDAAFRMTGVFCGDLEAAHAAAVAHLRAHVGIPVEKPYDLVVTHGGFVAQNHYQAAKAGVAALGALPQAGGGLILVADNRDAEPIGSDTYRIAIALLKALGPEALDRLLASPDWRFMVDQWEAQMWGKVLKRVKAEDFVYFAPQLGPGDRRILPGVDGRGLLGEAGGPHCRSGASALPPDSPAYREAAGREVAEVVRRSVARFLAGRGLSESDVASGKARVAWLADGPYGIPLAR